MKAVAECVTLRWDFCFLYEVAWPKHVNIKKKTLIRTSICRLKRQVLFSDICPVSITHTYLLDTNELQ